MKTLKDKIYELEGLVELADRRPDKFGDLRPLIQSRLDDVCKAWDSATMTAAEIVTPSEAEQPAETAVPQPQPESKTIALCLNDRFRFTRLLAAGDRKEFDRVLAEVTGRGDYESARDYLIESRGLDPSDPDVADLLEIVQQYYED